MTIGLNAAVLISFTCMNASASPDAKNNRKPNIVIIVADDLGWNCVGYHGGPVRTPQIDRLAQQGAILDRFYVSPMCSPTREGLMTGRYPMRYGMARSVIRPWMAYGLPTEECMIPELLAGDYPHRGAFGKWHLGHLDPKWHPLSRGFTQFKGSYNGAVDYWTRNRDGELDWHVNDVPTEEKGYVTDLIADAACTFIREHKADGPFFCYVPFTAPHDPLQAPDKYIEQYAHLDDTPNDGKPSEMQRLAAMVTCMDDGIGRILKTLDDAKIADNTLVWFFSDNGGVKGIADLNKPLKEGKLTAYEGGVRVPSVVRWPGRIPEGGKITEPIMNLDILPTLLHAANVNRKPSRPLDGVDVLDVLTGKAKSTSPRDMYFFNGQAGLQKEHIAVSTADGWKLVVVGPDVREAKGPRGKQHEIGLYHLSEDPNETKNLSADQPDLMKELWKKIVAFRKSEPSESMTPVNKAPDGFKPPSQWRNTCLKEPTNGCKTIATSSKEAQP